MAKDSSINIQSLHKQLIQTRQLVLKSVEGLTEEQLNTIPKGFKNNLAWHLGHILVTQQLLCYKLSSLSTKVSNEQIDDFIKGTSADRHYTLDEIEQVKSQLIPLANSFEEDYNKQLFNTYNSYKTSTGVVLTDIDEAFQFNLYHEGIHLGMILSMKHLI